MKKLLKENLGFILYIILMVLIVTVKLPYYIEAPGGTINLSAKMDDNYKKSNGSLNMLYVTEYKGNIVTVLLSKIIPTWDLYEISDQQVSNENINDIYLRNRIMLNYSIDNAMVVAYEYANKELNIKEVQNVIAAITKNNGLKIGDIILSIDDVPVENIDTIREHLSNLNAGDNVLIKYRRGNSEKTINIELDEDKLLGIVAVTNYVYDTDNNIHFSNGEGGASGGLVLSLGVYSKITGIDILKGRKIAGTGTIDASGNVGEIDGIKYKIMGAVRKKMDVILVSPYNYDEAKKIIEDNNYQIELVKVSTFKEAIEYLTK